ncbi:MAG: hypothetical protein SWZ49_06080, partial [Cyanobacteriota bacterium]|nr:hypothetical protein [Cyanobacteriota bacterium]
RALIPVYREKWRKIALSTEKVDKEKATEAIKTAYQWLNREEPLIEFFDSPYIVFKEINEIGADSSYFCILSNLQHPLVNYPYKIYRFANAIKKRTELEQIIAKLSLEINFNLYTQVFEDVQKEVASYDVGDDESQDAIRNNSLIAECCFYDFCISVLKLPHNRKKWEIFKNIIEHCGWMFDLDSYCLISNRPTSLSFDEQNNLHNDGKPAIEYADEFKVYAHHGTWIPEKYGSVPSSQWKSRWLLSEENAELRRILIQVIGYDRICKELGAIELDSWNEYTLLKIENYTEIKARRSENLPEPMHLLKMTCPSTGYIHFLRIPPNITSARVAITWINWEIDPEEFEIQT